MNRQQLLARLGSRWDEFVLSYAGLPESAMTQPGVVDDWSVKDILAHVTTWEEETLKTLPVLMDGKRTPLYGGIDRFNAEQTAQKRDLTLSEVLKQLAETHQRLLAFLRMVPESFFARETRVRRRARLDTYGHYSGHTASILAWRAEKGP